MAHHHSDAGDRPFRHYALVAVRIVTAVIVLSVLTHLSWNLFAPDLFGLPDVRMKQALGLVVFAGVLVFMLRHAVRNRHHG